MQWHYAREGQQMGPVEDDQLNQLVSDGVITSETLVWNATMSDWKPYAEVMGASSDPSPAAGGEPMETCAVSGKRYPRREMVQYEGKWISGEHRDRFFQSLREGVDISEASVIPGPGGYGNFGRRFVAYLIDSVILFAANQLVSALIFGMLAGTGNRDPQMLMIVSGVSLVINIGIALAYYILLIRKNDATLGKMALGLKVLRADGSKLSVGRIIGRYFGYIVSSIIFFIGFIMIGFDPERRGLHDRMCDTRVIKVRK